MVSFPPVSPPRPYTPPSPHPYAPHAQHTRTHTHTHTIRNTYCLSTVTLVTRTRLNVKLYVSCLSCYFPSSLHFTAFVLLSRRAACVLPKLSCPYTGQEPAAVRFDVSVGTQVDLLFMHLKCHTKIPFRHPLAWFCLKLPHESLPCQAGLSFAKWTPLDGS